MKKSNEVITAIDEPTYVEDINKLLAKYAIKEIHGVKIDIRRIKYEQFQ